MRYQLAKTADGRLAILYTDNHQIILDRVWAANLTIELDHWLKGTDQLPTITGETWQQQPNQDGTTGPNPHETDGADTSSTSGPEKLPNRHPTHE